MINERVAFPVVKQLFRLIGSHNGNGRGQEYLDIDGIRKHFYFARNGRIVTNNAATTQVPRDLMELYVSLAEKYDTVHRGQSTTSKNMTDLLEQAYGTIGDFLNAPAGSQNIVVYRNATEAINSVMYSLLPEFRDGDNVVTTMMEHTSNYVPWYAMCREILAKLGVHVEYRIANFSRTSGLLDMKHLESLIDSRTKLVCCTGASNFLGTRPPIMEIRELARKSGYCQPDGTKGSYFLIDGAQMVPGGFVDVQDIDMDFLAFSFHKMMAPFGVGVLYAKERILSSIKPFLYGGDMIAEGQVSPQKVMYNALPWKYAAGTPNILGTIASAQALRIILDFAINPYKHTYFGTDKKIERPVVKEAMTRVRRYLEYITDRALEKLRDIPGIQIYGPLECYKRTSLVAFNIKGWNPMELAETLNRYGVESRAGCHCATLAHHYLNLDPPASCRLSFYIYNTAQEVDIAAQVLNSIVRRRLHHNQAKTD